MSKWNKVQIGQLIVDGKAYSKTGPFGTQLKASQYVESGIPVINVRNIGFGDVREENLEYIDDSTAKRLSTHLLRKNEIVFGRKGAVERHAFIRSTQAGWLQGSDCIKLGFTTNDINPRFISYYLLTNEHKTWMKNQCSHGATMASLNQDIIGRISISIPDKQIQDKIASILSAYDDLIENNLRRIKVLEEMAQRIYQEWFVHFRFPGHENVKMVESELGLIPEGWSVKRLGEVCAVIMGQSPKSEFYNETGDGTPFHQGVSNFGAHYPIDKVFSTQVTRMAEKDDVLFSVRAPVGKINIADKVIGLGRGLSAIRVKNGSQRFILYQLKNIFDVVDKIGNGSIFNSVSKRDIEDIKILMPTNDEITMFEDVSSNLLQEIYLLTKKNNNLRKTRDVLLPRLISGELDVENLDIAIPEDNE